MKKNIYKKKASIKRQTLLLLFVLILVTFWFFYQSGNHVSKTNENKYPVNIFYKVFSYSNYYSSIQEFYSFRANEIQKMNKNLSTIDKQDIINQEKPPVNQENINNDPEKTDEQQEKILINSSLTGTPGVITVNGTTSGIDIYFNGQKVNSENGSFSFNASASYSIQIKGKKINKKLTISSPSYGTNKIISQLTLQINPIEMTATIIGKLNLMLPGEIKGSLFNLSNSSSSSTVLKKGYFATSVIINEGTNQLTATGEWFTIKLELPTLQVVVTK